jgi:SAM-dependent methyltransferase
MPKTAAFDRHHARYESWFVRHAAAYRSELLAVRGFVPPRGSGLEVGVGTGRFAGPLGVTVGLDPSRPMLDVARTRGVVVVQGVAESLPFRARTFDCVLVVTTICFVDDAEAMVAEARRVLAPAGRIVIGFIDRESPVGRDYLDTRAVGPFYADATFFSSAEVERLLSRGGFGRQQWCQTLFGPPETTSEPEAARPGRGRGAFAVVSAPVM